MKNILYKYRSLENFKNFVDIILKDRLFASKYKDLNDPMEGQYYYNSGDLDKITKDKLTNSKEELRLCSLSKVNNNELMWSHYSNGQRGVAIGLEVDESNCLIKPIHYNGLAFLKKNNITDQSAIEILSHKLNVWEYEKEVRVFVKDQHFIKVQVKEIITGRAMSNSDFVFIKELIEKINPNIKLIKGQTLMID